MAARKRKLFQKKLIYDALSFMQRGKGGARVVMFVAPVGEILSFAAVAQLSPNKPGPQRERKEARVLAIAKFLAANKANIIPTAVILAFDEGTAVFDGSASKRVGSLEIRLGKSHVATIVDGQHRLIGIDAADPKMEVAVVALLDTDEVERAFQFLVINNKSSKVPTTHIKALLAKMKDSGLADRLKSARLAFDVEGINDVDLVNSDRDSPFYKSIDWTTTPVNSRIVPATAIEASLDYIGGLGVPEYEDRDIRRSVFLAIWRKIHEQWNPLWKKDSRLLSKVGIVCLTRFITDLITSWADNDELKIEVTNLADIADQTKKIIEPMDPRFWTTPWSEKAQGGFDTNQGRERVLLAITQLFRNGRRNSPWYTDIEIINRSAAKG
jgi:DGQHR domain-containing protein